MSKNAYIALLSSNRNYRHLFTARSISLFGDWLNTIAIFILLREITQAEALAFGFVIVIKMLPHALFAGVAGVVADRYDRTNIMLVSDLLRAAVVCCFLLVKFFPSPLLVYSLLALQTAASTFFEPAKNAFLPDIVGKEELLTANALSAFVWSSMLALGTAFGGVATEFFGWEAVLLLDALTYLVSAFYIRKIQCSLVSSKTSLQHSKKEKINLAMGVQDIKDAYYYLREHPRVLLLATTKGLYCLGGATSLLLAIFGTEIYPLGTTAALGISVFYIARGIGSAIGPIVGRYFAGDSRTRMRKFIVYSILLSIVSYLAFAKTENLPLACLCVALGHFGGGILWTFSTVLLQQEVPSELRGRVFGFELGLFTLTLSAATLLHGHLIEYQIVTPRTSVEILAYTWVFLLGIWVWGLRLWKQESYTARE